MNVVRALHRGLPWLFPAAAGGGVLLHYGTPGPQIALYAAYFLLVVLVPGTLVIRALYGSRGNWPEDLGFGGATGLVLLLAGWALAAATGLQAYLPFWPVVIVLPFLVAPRLRRHWRIREPEPLPLRWSWAMATVLALIVMWGATVFAVAPLPPVTGQIYQDLYYHLALVHEMTRSMPFQVPQLAGSELRYHYLSDADMAAASMITGISPVTVFLRLWILPVVVVGALVCAAAGRSASGRWWAGPLAAALGFAGNAITAGSPIPVVLVGEPVSLVSPSQTYAMPLIGLFTVLAMEALRGRSLRWTWVLIPALAVVCAGAKSSVLPPLIAGIGLAGLVLLIRRRRIPWPAVGLLGAALFGMAAGFRLFAGGGAGILTVQPLAVLYWFTPYAQTLKIPGEELAGGFLPLGVASAGPDGRWLAAGLVLWWALMQAPRLIGLVLWPRPRETAAGPADPARWLLGGTVVAGMCGAWLLAHPSLSQGYFFAGAVPASGVLTAWALAGRSWNWWIPAAGLLAGVLWQLLTPAGRSPVEPTVETWAWALAEPVLITAAAMGATILILTLIWRVRAARALPVLLIAAVAGAGLTSGVASSVRSLADGPSEAQRFTGSPADSLKITESEMRAALWLDAHAGPDDLVATNVHCQPIRPGKTCNARGFWVAGLGGRRTLVEGWGYTDQAVAGHGRYGRQYFEQPAPDPEIFALNERAFVEGDPADLARLRDLGVRWLFADSRAGPVATGLGEVRLMLGPVTVYEIGPSTG